MTATAATYTNQIDWNGDGAFGLGGDDVTVRTLDQRTAVTVKYGRDQDRQLSPTSPGQAAFELNNRSRDYSPENTSSPLYGLVLPSRSNQITATYGGTTYGVWTGFLDEFDAKPDLLDQSVDVTCTDALGRLKGVNITTSIYQGVRTGDAINALLDAVGWPSSMRDLDAGASYLPYWWLDGADAFDSLMQLVDSEGPAALATVDTTGRIVFRDRHHRLTRSASLTVQSTWRSSGAEPQISSPTVYDNGWSEIVNYVSVDVPMRTVEANATVVWSSSGQLTFPVGGITEITASSTNAFINAIPPQLGIDYTVLTGSATIALTRTSGQSTTLQVTATAGTIIVGLQLQAYVLDSTSVTITVSDPVSVAAYGPRSMQDVRLPVWANPYDALAILQLIVGKRAQRVPAISVTMRGAGAPARLLQCLTRNLSDRVHVTESQTGLDADCYVEQISHTIDQGGLQHVTVFGLEKIPVVVSNVFTFDVAGKGFDQGMFGQIGQDNPVTMLRFDTSGQGFDQGCFAN